MGENEIKYHKCTNKSPFIVPDNFKNEVKYDKCFKSLMDINFELSNDMKNEKCIYKSPMSYTDDFENEIKYDKCFKTPKDVHLHVYNKIKDEKCIYISPFDFPNALENEVRQEECINKLSRDANGGLYEMKDGKCIYILPFDFPDYFDDYTKFDKCSKSLLDVYSSFTSLQVKDEKCIYKSPFYFPDMIRNEVKQERCINKSSIGVYSDLSNELKDECISRSSFSTTDDSESEMDYDEHFKLSVGVHSDFRNKIKDEESICMSPFDFPDDCDNKVKYNKCFSSMDLHSDLYNKMKKEKCIYKPLFNFSDDFKNEIQNDMYNNTTKDFYCDLGDKSNYDKNINQSSVDSSVDLHSEIREDKYSNQSVDSPAKDYATKSSIDVCADFKFPFSKKMKNKRRTIPNCYDKQVWMINNMYNLRVSHIYSPSKFWVVTKVKELDLFHRYLHYFYSRNGKFYKISTSDILLHMYCVVYSDGCFFRASIINLSMAVRNKTLVYAFLVDFGSIVQVDSSDVYLLNEKMYTVPQFAVRATLTGLAPFNSSTWSAAAVTNFYKLVEERVLLAKVTNVDNLNKTLYLHLGDYNSDTQHVKSVNCALVQNKFAKLITTSDLPKMAQNENKVYNLQFLLPSFDSIEAGLCPDTVLVANSLQEYVVKYQNK